jgi:hypothetical protein
MMYNAANDPVRLHLPKLLDQHLLRDRRNGSLQLGKSQKISAKEMEQDQQLPAALEDLEGLLDAQSGV